MAEAKNPLTERVKKMTVILEAAKKVSQEKEEGETKEGQGETGQSGQSS